MRMEFLKRLFSHGRSQAKAAVGPVEDLAVTVLVNRILIDALSRRASEIQIGCWQRPEEGSKPESELDRLNLLLAENQDKTDSRQAGMAFEVRFCIAGELKTIMILPHGLCPAVMVRIKELAGLGSATPLPQSSAGQPASKDALRGHIRLGDTRDGGTDVSAEFAVTILAGEEQEKLLLHINYDESADRRAAPQG